MQRVGGLLQTAARGLWQQTHLGLGLQGQALRSFYPSQPNGSDPVRSGEQSPASGEFEHATGMEKAELEGLKKGVDIFHEDWITKEFAGTAQDPVVVQSAYAERIVGVPDPEDDCLVIWDIIKANEPPKQIVEGGEYFVLQTTEPEAWTGIPESFKGGSHH